MPAYIQGVLNLRGKIIPVADLRIKFGLTSAENTDLTCIVVVSITLADKTSSLMGLVVDGVEEVVNIAASDIKRARFRSCRRDGLHPGHGQDQRHGQEPLDVTRSFPASVKQCSNPAPTHDLPQAPGIQMEIKPNKSIALTKEWRLPLSVRAGTGRHYRLPGLSRPATCLEDVAASYENLADNLGDKIDHQALRRRSGVQRERPSTTKILVSGRQRKEQDRRRRQPLRKPRHLLGYVVDLDGKVIAVNDRAPSGKAIDTAWLYQKNFKDTAWFKESLAGHFLKSETLDGTFVEDVQADEDVKKVYGNDGLVLGLSAPVRDANGKVVGVWHNCANFSLVEELVTVPMISSKKQNNLTTAVFPFWITLAGSSWITILPATVANPEVQHDPSDIETNPCRTWAGFGKKSGSRQSPAMKLIRRQSFPPYRAMLCVTANLAFRA
ncbi:MAG: chemotaxis protein CheW [Verrucomicrobiota bacterium]